MLHASRQLQLAAGARMTHAGPLLLRPTPARPNAHGRAGRGTCTNTSTAAAAAPTHARAASHCLSWKAPSYCHCGCTRARPPTGVCGERRGECGCHVHERGREGGPRGAQVRQGQRDARGLPRGALRGVPGAGAVARGGNGTRGRAWFAWAWCMSGRAGVRGAGAGLLLQVLRVWCAAAHAGIVVCGHGMGTGVFVPGWLEGKGGARQQGGDGGNAGRGCPL